MRKTAVATGDPDKDALRRLLKDRPEDVLDLYANFRGARKDGKLIAAALLALVDKGITKRGLLALKGALLLGAKVGAQDTAARDSLVRTYGILAGVDFNVANERLSKTID